MRQQHQKSRSRGRNRKPQNPMSRNYESNGPDVKIRGNAAHIAEKYSTLARDALSNGDTVMAENYFQHAEHYNRIVAAAQAQKAEEQAAAAANGRGPQPDVSENTANGSGQQSTNGEAAPTEASDGEAASETGEAPNERKNGRGRRTKRVAADQNGESSSEEASEVAEDKTKPEVDVEAVSEDAASLPQSITGGLQVEES